LRTPSPLSPSPVTHRSIDRLLFVWHTNNEMARVESASHGLVRIARDACPREGIE
jgi:hypothetical protein